MPTHLISSMTIALQTEIALADPGKGATGAYALIKSGKYTFFHNLATFFNIFDIFSGSLRSPFNHYTISTPYTESNQYN